MLHMPGRSYAGPLKPLTPEETALRDRLARHVDILAGVIGERHVGRPTALEGAARYVEKSLRQFGFTVGEQRYHAGGGVSVRNLDAEIPGHSRADEILVVGAHYDSVPGSPAANDNATGVAAVLEMARALRDSRPNRTIRIVGFVNEEPPYFQTALMGSRVYARRCRQLGQNIVGMLTPETIGFYTDAPRSQSYPIPGARLMGFPDRGNFLAFVANVASEKWLHECIGSFRRHTAFPSEGIAAPGQIVGIGFSDHWSFWQEGYPAIMLTDTAPYRYPYYHTSQDAADKIDHDRLARVVSGLIRMVAELASATTT